MLRAKKINYLGSISFEKKIIYAKLLEFIEESLPHFPIFFRENGVGLTKENDITQLLDTFLNIKVREAELSMFLFKNQFNVPNNSRSYDMGVIVLHFSKKDAFFTIEAKRLPTPGSTREREYVQGNLGGMERFKRGHHGSGLPVGAILGYIQNNNAKHWHKTINSWIEDLIKTNKDKTITWESSDKLIDKSVAGFSKYSSSSTRSSGDPITLFHYWLDLN